MKKIKVQVFNQSPFELPSYATSLSSGLDIRADFSRIENSGEIGRGCLFDLEQKAITIPPLCRVIIPTGLYVAIPEGWELQVAPRSGMSYKVGLTCANARGCIDSDYRGEVGVIVVNLSNENVVIPHSERIAQFIPSETPKIEWDVVDEISHLGETERGSGGYGHTGKK